jgi:hypothetical protein
MKIGSILNSAFLLCLLLASGCSPQAPIQVGKLFPSIVDPTPTPFLPVPATPTATATPTVTPLPIQEYTYWLDASVPPALTAAIHLPEGIDLAENAEQATLQIGALRGGEFKTTWVYALAAPFPTLIDNLSLDEIQRAWRGEAGDQFTGTLLVSADTQAAFAARFGPPGPGRLTVVAKDQLLDQAWNDPSALAIIPFEDIQPRWKVLHVDGYSLFDRGLNLADYPLTLWFGVNGSPDALKLLTQSVSADSQIFPASNRDPEQMTVLVMTGVTALTRATGYKMDTLGTSYPGHDIQDWLRNADLTHISNEVSFNPDCPKASFSDTSTIFCSRPEYIELLDFIGADIIELSGNHNNDYGVAADSYSLDLYKQRNWLTFAGGSNLEEARKPALVENHGNKLAFIGCNPVGPRGAWATDSAPGAAPCNDYAWMLDQIRQLRSDGYLPIATFQYSEVYTHGLSTNQDKVFQSAADAGAVIVSGSQAHFPQYMTFYQDSFIHYGLGNLFFDQMDNPVVGTRQEFIDSHIFYQGRYIQTELLTALLEDYAKPRPMTDSERQSFLTDIFKAAGWR